jgi:two-component system, chemotaxis family, protein-glutamate methylesterase/glutaminase
VRQDEGRARDIVVVGASAGGVEALMELVRGLPSDFPAALFVVLHLPAQSSSNLPRILSRAGSLEASHALDLEPIRRGRVYVAPPDRHLLLEPGFVRVVRAPKENGHRPAIDPLFRSAARAYCSRVIGVVLTGGGNDGSTGLLAIKREGGLAVVQDPEDALTPSMPRAACELVDVDHCLPLQSIPGALLRLLMGPPAMHERHREEGRFTMPEKLEVEARHPNDDAARRAADYTLRESSGYSCPECGGRLWEFDEENVLRFRCRVGHGYTAESLVAEKTNALEAALWAAVNALEESVELSTRLATRARDRGHDLSALRFSERAHETGLQIQLLRELLMRDYTGPDVGGSGGADQEDAHSAVMTHPTP